MDDQTEKLEAFYVRCAHESSREEGDDFDNDGDYWEFKNPEKVESWSLHMIPFKNLICFAAKFKDTDHFFNISFDEKIKDVAHDSGPFLKIRCVTIVTGTSPKASSTTSLFAWTPQDVPSTYRTSSQRWNRLSTERRYPTLRRKLTTTTSRQRTGSWQRGRPYTLA